MKSVPQNPVTLDLVCRILRRRGFKEYADYQDGDAIRNAKEPQWPHERFYDAPDGARITASASEMVHEAAEEYRVLLYDGAWCICREEGRLRVTPEDVRKCLERLTAIANPPAPQ